MEMAIGLFSTLVVFAFVSVVWAIAAYTPKPKPHLVTYEERNLRALAWVENRMLQLWAEFPSLSAETVARIVYDELVNARVTDAFLYHWVTAETAARVQRTVVLSAIRSGRPRF